MTLDFNNQSPTTPPFLSSLLTIRFGIYHALNHGFYFFLCDSNSFVLGDRIKDEVAVRSIQPFHENRLQSVHINARTLHVILEGNAPCARSFLRTEISRSSSLSTSPAGGSSSSILDHEVLELTPHSFSASSSTAVPSEPHLVPQLFNRFTVGYIFSKFIVQLELFRLDFFHGYFEETSLPASSSAG